MKKPLSALVSIIHLAHRFMEEQTQDIKKWIPVKKCVKPKRCAYKKLKKQNFKFIIQINNKKATNSTTYVTLRDYHVQVGVYTTWEC